MGCGASQALQSDSSHQQPHQQPIPQHVLTDESEPKSVLGESPRGTSFFFPVMVVPVVNLVTLPRMLPHEEMKEHLVEWTPKMGKLLLISHQVAGAVAWHSGVAQRWHSDVAQ